MRNTLQYLYTILVFSGALTTSYLMVSQNEMRNQTRTAQNVESKSTYRREAAFDNAVTKLFEVENALSRFPSSNARTPAVDPFQRFEKTQPKDNKLIAPPSRHVGEREHADDSSAQLGQFDLLKP